MTAEAFKALFDTDDLSTPSIDMSTVKEMIMKLLDDLDDTDLKAAQIKLNVNFVTFGTILDIDILANNLLLFLMCLKFNPPFIEFESKNANI